MSHSRRRLHLPLILAILLILLLLGLSTAAAAEIGYGPDFDPCGDNCQTQMVAFCTIGHNTDQMRECWCNDAQYISRMDACLESCDPAVSDRALQRDQLLRYRTIVCDPVAISSDSQFAQYYQTRYANVDGGKFVPEVTRGIPPPTASPRTVLLVSTTEENIVSTFLGSSSTSDIDSQPSSTFLTRAKTTTTTVTFSSTATASSLVTALPSTAAGPTMQRTGLTTIQLIAVIIATAIVSVLFSLSLVFCIRRRHPPKRPFWNPPPPPPLPRPSPTSFLPYYHPTSPPPTVLASLRNTRDLEPHAITTSAASIYTARDTESSFISPTRERGRFSYFSRESPMPSPEQAQFQNHTRATSVSTRMLTPIATPTQAVIQITSASAIAAAVAAAEAERSNRGSTHTIIEPELQQGILQGILLERDRSRSRSRSRPRTRGRLSERRSERNVHWEDSEYCGEDDCTASCSSLSERSWYEEDDTWWDLRDSEVMGS